MANVRELKRKVASLRNMQKVMRAMNMISTTKLQKILPQHPALLTFEKGALEMATEIAMALHGEDNPCITQTTELRRICVVTFTSDKGLCGSHNSSVQRAAATLMKSMKSADVEVDAACVGTRGASFFRRNDYDVHLSLESNDRSVTDADVRRLAKKLVSRIQTHEIQQVHFVFNAYVSTLLQMTKTIEILPFDALLPKDLPEPLPTFAVESGEKGFAVEAVEHVLFCLLRSALRHSHLSEHAARMTAMDNATNNSEDLISRYGAIRNRARQATITSELIEIIAGNEALKGR